MFDKYSHLYVLSYRYFHALVKKIVGGGECMKNPAVMDKLTLRRSGLKKNLDQYYSIEFSLNKLSVPYQFKVWQATSDCMWVLVREDSDILSLVKIGDTVNIKCYPSNRGFPPEYRDTAIRHITKNDQGRFKGHCLVGFGLLEGQYRKEHLRLTR